MAESEDPQLDFFQSDGERPPVDAAPILPEHEALALELPALLQLGTMSWSYPGWRGIVFAPGVSERVLAPRGLTAYGQHPLLRAVEIDRTYYEPLPATVFQAYRAQVDGRFSFLVKAHDELVIEKFPIHPRYGARAGRPSLRFLDAAYATDQVIGPTMEGLGSSLGALVFQFPPQESAVPEAFAERLHQFLSRLPRGPTYAVELRSHALLTREYGEALVAAGAIHCHNAWGQMPTVLMQAKALPKQTRRPLLIRWLMGRGDTYEAAKARYEPFNQLVDEDLSTRGQVAELVTRALARDVAAWVTVDNKAEGCAPETIVRLAREIAKRRRGYAAQSITTLPD